MFKSLVLALLLSSGMAFAEVRVYQTDAVGNIQYHKPSYVITEKGRVIPVDVVGNKLYHKQQNQLKPKGK